MNASATKKNRKAIVTDVHRAESERLLALWKSRPHASQAVFGELWDIGSQSAVAQFLHGKAPISSKAARGFAAGLKCSIADFSERLSREADLNSAFSGTGASSSAELTKRMASADDATRKLIEIALLEDDETAISKLTPSLVNLVRAIKVMIREQG